MHLSDWQILIHILTYFIRDRCRLRGRQWNLSLLFVYFVSKRLSSFILVLCVRLLCGCSPFNFNTRNVYDIYYLMNAECPMPTHIGMHFIFGCFKYCDVCDWMFSIQLRESSFYMRFNNFIEYTILLLFLLQNSSIDQYVIFHQFSSFISFSLFHYNYYNWTIYNKNLKCKSCALLLIYSSNLLVASC